MARLWAGFDDIGAADAFGVAREVSVPKRGATAGSELSLEHDRTRERIFGERSAFAKRHAKGDERASGICEAVHPQLAELHRGEARSGILREAVEETLKDPSRSVGLASATRRECLCQQLGRIFRKPSTGPGRRYRSLWAGGALGPRLRAARLGLRRLPLVRRPR